MGWSIGWDSTWNRDIGYGVPAYCDHPECWAEIDRGLGYVCGGDPYGGEHGCGLFFCGRHLFHGKHGLRCKQCNHGKQPFTPKEDHPDWLHFKETDSSWAFWREERDNKTAAPPKCPT